MFDRKSLGKLAEMSGIAVGLVGVVYGVLSFIDYRIEKKITDETTLRKLAELVRPSCIFDERGSVVFDSGAMKSIEAIEITEPGIKKVEWPDALPKKIVVHPNRHLAYAPLLSVVSTYAYDIKVERGPKFDWVYTLSWGSASGNGPFDKCLFRMEIL